MFYYLWDYTAWYNWMYNIPTEPIKLDEEPPKLYKEVETQTEPNKVEIAPVETQINLAELETQQEHPVTKKTRRR